MYQFLGKALLLILSGFLLPHVAFPQVTCGERCGVKRLVEFHQQHKKSLQVQDVYKMLYQASFGVEHLLVDTLSVRSYLLNELASMDTINRGETLLEQISTTGEIVRVNLRPFKALKLDPESLVQIMFRSARATTPDTALFQRNWEDFKSLIRYGLLNFPIEGLGEWESQLPSGVIAPVHHSTPYVEANAPAYRVVRCDIFESVFGNRELNE